MGMAVSFLAKDKIILRRLFTKKWLNKSEKGSLKAFGPADAY